MNKEQLIKVIDFWQRTAQEGALFPRTLVNQINLKTREITDIVGPRRSGKSSLLRLLIRAIATPDNWLYINFEDPFFIENNQTGVIEETVDIYKEYFSSKLRLLFFDEIQNVENWEKAVRKLYESGRYKIFITGSSSKLLSRELSSLITGRHLSYELMPLAFDEYLSFRGIRLEGRRDLVLQELKIGKHLSEYLKYGGFPKIVLDKNIELLKQYYSDILEKDIIKRYDIRQKTILEKMGVFLLSNAAKTISLSSLEKAFSVSFEMASAYLDYFKEAFLLYELSQFSYSLKTQQKALKKIYAVDTGLANAVSFRFSDDFGRILENCVYLQLRRIAKELYYYKTENNLEVDFLIKRNNKKTEFMQVCADFDNEKTKGREVKAILEAMQEMKVASGSILTISVRDAIRTQGRVIKVVPVHEWLLTSRSVYT